MEDILDQRGHRPYPPPESPWLMTQTWEWLLFAHYPVDPHVLSRLIPPPLEIDLYEGSAWVAIVPFKVQSFRPRLIPALPWISYCNELNVRTYVHYKGRAGVYFFSLDTDSLSSVAGARSWFGLPYYWARMSASLQTDGRIRYRMSRLPLQKNSESRFSGIYCPCCDALPVTRSSFEIWSTERYRLLTVDKGRVYTGEIHHPPWRLRRANLELFENNLLRELGLNESGEPVLHFAETQKVLFWPPQKID